MLNEIELFDSHTHIGPDFYSRVKGNLYRTFYAEDLIQAMEKNNVKKAIIIPGVTTRSIVCPEYKICDNLNKPPILLKKEKTSYTLQCPVCETIWKVKRNPYIRKNDLLIKAATKYPNRLFPFPIIDPRYPKSSRYLEKLVKTSKDIRGIKIHLVATFYDPKELIDSELINVIEDYDLCVLFDPFQFRFSHDILKVATSHPKAKFIIAHCAGLDEEVLKKIRQIENVYVDTSAASQFYDKTKSRGNFRLVDSAQTVYELLIDYIGADKLIFGTDFPVADYSEQIETFRRLNFDASTLEKIGYKNLEELLNLV
ncbi:MAG: amidohydrolase family protein [Candidatus Aenigmatarchaeota archaeon]